MPHHQSNTAENNTLSMSNIMSTLIPDLETRKKQTASILECTSSIIDPIAKDNKTKGYVIVLLHILMCFPTYLYLCFGSYNPMYYTCLIIWIFIFILHFYFNGCILIRMERHFFDDKEWKGIWSPLFNSLNNIGVEYSKSYMNNIFICSGVLLLLIIFLRFIL